MLAMPTPSSTAEETTRGSDGSPIETKNSDIPTTSADQERGEGRQHEVDGARRQRRRQHADEMHGPDTDGEKERGAGEQHTR